METRGSLFEKSARPFHRVFALEHRAGVAGLDAHPLCFGEPETLARGAQHGFHRDGTIGGDLLGERRRGLDEFGARDDSVQESAQKALRTTDSLVSRCFERFHRSL